MSSRDQPDKSPQTETDSALDASNASDAPDGINPMALIPELFGKFFEFFRPGHTDGFVPARIKELARLKVAAINECDT